MELQPCSPSKTLLNIGRENSKLIPIDLVTEILSRLPVKSIGSCLCVSKMWTSMLRLPYFTELFSTRSSARPKILFAYSRKGEVVFFSSTKPQNPDENSSSSVDANHLSRVLFGGSFRHIAGHVHGLVGLTATEKISEGYKNMISTVHKICNPSTGQTLTLPTVVTMVRVGHNPMVVSFLGYVPIDKQFKVLYSPNLDGQHQVLTLGTQKLEWRIIKCCVPHHCIGDGICINGVLYYPALHAHTLTTIIVCIHVRSEEFSSIELEMTFKVAVLRGKLINYNGKLGSLLCQGNDYADGASRSFELLVIGDFQKQEWSTHKYVLPPMWKNMVGEFYINFKKPRPPSIRFVGFIGTDTIVLSHPSYVIYYNIVRNTIVKVGTQGLEGFRYYTAFTFVDYVEDLKLVNEF